MLDKRELRDLIDIVLETGIAEIEIQQGKTSVRICRESASAKIHTLSAPMVAPLQPSSEAVHSVTAPVIASPVEEHQNQHAIKSPMVGTAYLLPAPDKKPFVEVGQVVKAGDTLCLIEAMKTFNPIEADKSGKIVAVLVEHGSSVEFGQPLFFIE
jgi:acetyl-CoA carboxylase biotin carboxyl carrier protein